MHHHHIGYLDDGRNRSDVADEIEIEFFIERRINRVRCSNHEERIAVRRRLHDRLSGDIAAGTLPVLDDELLTEPLREPLTHEARENVIRAARWKAGN